MADNGKVYRSKKVRDESFIIYPKEVKVYLAATDKHVGTETIFYSISGGEEKTYTRPIQYFRQGQTLPLILGHWIF